MFREIFKQETEQLDPALLPLQQGLATSSHVADSSFSVLLLTSEETPDCVRVKAGIAYAGIIAGCSCADDPTPIAEQAEYCEVWFEISKTTAEANISLLVD